ncbi:MAG TPA: rhomboid family intramembrane serine protease [Coriobacteriia bacterium]|nr:rhomboid family intramembrane serine protease [Coriobacteriia bacterium]
MIPIRARRRSASLPFLTWTLMLTCTAVMVRLALLPDARATSIFGALAVVPARLFSTPFQPGQLITLVTSAFLHAGWVHLIGNLIFLWVFGPVVESRIGRLAFGALYFASGIAGALCFALISPASTTPLVGASAAIAGVLGAAIVLDPTAEITAIIPLVVWFEVAELPAAFMIGMWFLLQVASAVAPVVEGAGATIAWTAHIGGFVLGAAVALVANGGRISTTARSRRAV